jgi:outer membrane protein assembly factor BamE (lipoprotein component of BamABCDE complex)
MRKLPLLFLLFAACTSPGAPGYLDSARWERDDNGCNEYRSGVINEHPELLTALKGKSEDEIIEWLGKPDKNELYKRSQKFYIYAIDPTDDCASAGTKHRYLQIRFNATNRAQEVMIYE